jgi:pilus assembly protein Flp/PilA
MFANYWQVKGAILGIVSIICFGLEVKMWNLRSSEKGQGLVEYALILVLIAVVVIAILTLTGSQLNMIFARIVLQLEHPGDYSGDPVTVEEMNVSADIGWGGDIDVSATVNLEGASGSPPICVRFTDSQNGSKTVCDPNPATSFPLHGTGTVEACVIGVQGYSLGGMVCDSDSYPP